jgi:hypothetical protein
MNIEFRHLVGPPWLLWFASVLSTGGRPINQPCLYKEESEFASHCRCLFGIVDISRVASFTTFVSTNKWTFENQINGGELASAVGVSESSVKRRLASSDVDSLS